MINHFFLFLQKDFIFHKNMLFLTKMGTKKYNLDQPLVPWKIIDLYSKYLFHDVNNPFIHLNHHT